MQVTIKTNNAPRHTLDWRDLTPKEQAEFDYLDSDDREYCAIFVRYRGWVYDLGEFMRVDSNTALAGWHGYSSDSFFSGVLIRYVDSDADSVIMGTYYS